MINILYDLKNISLFVHFRLINNHKTDEYKSYLHFVKLKTLDEKVVVQVSPKKKTCIVRFVGDDEKN